MDALHVLTQRNSLDAVVHVDGNKSRKMNNLLDHFPIRPEYTVVATQNFHPLSLCEQQLSFAKSLLGFTSFRQSQLIFDYMCATITYQHSNSVGYRRADQVMREGYGICGESTFMYMNLARLVGLRSSFIGVFEDYNERQVSHACAFVDFGDRSVLVDCAYRMFDVKHKDARVYDDARAVRCYQIWNDVLCDSKV